MLLIVEGMDICGKSTLISNLRKYYFLSPNIVVHHSSSPPKVDDPNEWEVEHYSSLFRVYNKLVKQKNFTVLFDRFHLGSIVYGQKYRNMKPDDILEVDQKWLNGNYESAVILLTDNPEDVYQRDDGYSLEASIEDYEETQKSFINAFDSSRCPNKLHINISDNGGFENTFGTVTRFLDERFECKQ